MSTNKEVLRDGYSQPGFTINWGAIFAGLALILSLGWLWVTLSAAIGLSIIDIDQLQDSDMSSGEVKSIGMAAMLWMIVSAVITYFLGGFLSGKVSGRPNQATGTLHGVVLWSCTIIIGMILGAIGVSGIVSTATGAAKSVASSFGNTLQMGTDIGKMIPHFGTPNLNLIVVIGFSKSKSLFGSSTVMAENKPVATACLVYANLNLNCASPVSWPIAAVSAPNTAMAGMSFGDYLAGAVEAAVSMAIDYLMNKIGDGLTNGIATRLASRVTGFVGINGGKIVIEGIENLTAAEINAVGGRGALIVEGLFTKLISDRIRDLPLTAYEAGTGEGVERTYGRAAGNASDGRPGTPQEQASVPEYY